MKRLQDRLGELNDAWTAEQLGEGQSARIREAIAAAHPSKEGKASHAAAAKALAKAEAAAGYWRTARPDEEIFDRLGASEGEAIEEILES